MENDNNSIKITMKLEDITLEEIKLIHDKFNYQCANCPLRCLGTICSNISKMDLSQQVEI